MRKTKVADSDFTYLLTSQYRGANSKKKNQAHKMFINVEDKIVKNSKI